MILNWQAGSLTSQFRLVLFFGFALLFNSILELNLGTIAVTFISFCVVTVTRVIEYIIDHRNGACAPNPRATGAYVCGLLLISAMVVMVASL